jgi:hypothetical protein
MATARTDEQIRADVEHAIRQAVGFATALPAAVAGRMLRCAAHTTARLMDLVPPLRLIRSAFDLTLANVVTPAESSLQGDAASITRTPVASAVATAAAPPARTARRTPGRARAVKVAGITNSTDALGAADAADALPIAEYESLAASQVVARLESLTADELRAVQAFEVAHRGRRTVLGKIDQLLT